MVAVMLLFAVGAVAAADGTDARDPGPGPAPSIAAEDGFGALFANPAAIGVGNSDGVALSYRYPLGAGAATAEEALEGLTLYSGGLGTSYAYRYAEGRHVQNLGIGVEAGRNLYLGGAAGIKDFDTDTLALSGGFLYRPIDYLSIGTVVDGTLDGDPAVGAGIGVRPLAFSEDYEDLISIDANVRYTAGGGVTFPRVGVTLHAPEGLRLEGAYDVTGEAFTVGGSISYGNLRTGGGYSAAPATGSGESGGDDLQGSAGAFLHVSPKRFPTSPAFEGEYVAEYEPGPMIAERAPGGQFPGIAELTETTSITQVIEEIRRLQEDPRVSGILFRNHNLSISLANVHELQTALQEFKDAGKKVVFYYETVSNVNYALAAGVADAIYLHPQGTVVLSGLGGAQPYLAGLFDRLGVGINNIRSHPPKSAYNLFSESGATEAERENLETLYDGLYDVFTGMIRDGRGDRLSGSVEEIVDGGPYLTAQSALEAGVVDELLHHDEVDDAVAELVDGARPSNASFTQRMETSWSEPPVHRVGIIYGIGGIAPGEGQPGVSIGSETMARAIRKAREDRSIKAIIIRIDSGGGSSLASEVIAREVALTTEGPDAKPLVVSMGATAASGGYYIAAPADRIVAQPSTVTGSIGVVTLLFNIAELSEKIGVNWDTFLRGENADFGALYRELEPQERERLEESIRSTYDIFVRTVADGRDMSTDDVDRIGRGQVWTGTQARDRGLVDDLGGWVETIDIVRELLPGDRELVFKEFTGVDNRFESMIGLGFLPMALEPLRAELLGESAVPAELQQLAELQQELERYGSERTLMLAPRDLAPRSE